MCPIPINEGATVLKILEDIRGDIWFGYSRYNGYNAMCEGKWVVLDISKLKELIKGPVTRINPVLVEHEINEIKGIESDYTGKLDKIFEKLKSNDDKINKEAIEEFISLKTISKEYLIKKLNETSDELLKWRINAILSRIE